MFKVIGDILVAVLSKVNLKEAWNEVLKIPSALKHFLAFSIILGVCYFGYRKVEEIVDVTNLHKDVMTLKSRVDSQVPNETYVKDHVYYINCIKILDEMQTFNYHEFMITLDMFSDYLREKDPNSQILYDIRAQKHRYQLEYEVLQKCIQQTLEQVNADIDADTIINSSDNSQNFSQYGQNK